MRKDTNLIEKMQTRKGKRTHRGTIVRYNVVFEGSKKKYTYAAVYIFDDDKWYTTSGEKIPHKEFKKFLNSDEVLDMKVFY